MKIRRIDYSPDEMIAGIAGQLDPLDFGVYWMVCTLIYSRGGPIANDHKWIARLFRDTNPRTIRAAINRLVEAGKIEMKTGPKGAELMVKRCRSELERALNRTRKAAENGSKGGRPSSKNKDLTKAGGFQDEKLTINEQPSTNNHQLNTPLSPPQGGDGKKAKSKRGTRLEHKDPPADWLKWARTEGHPDPDREWLTFRDYWIAAPGARGVKLDWEATWRNWIRRSLDQRKPPFKPANRLGMAEPASSESFRQTPEELKQQEKIMEKW